MTGRSLFALFAALCLPASAVAGAVLELVTTEYYNEDASPGTIEISTEGGSSRMEFVAAGSGETSGMIFLGERREMIALDHDSKEYYVLDDAAMQQMATQVSGAMQQMQEALKDLPPEQRAMAEQMMKDRMPQLAEPAPTVLEETGATDSVKGYDCRYYEVQKAGRKVSELCVADWSEIEGGSEAADSMLRMADFFESMARAFSEAAGMDVMGQQRELFAHLREIDGYPVLTREFDEAGELSSETRLQSAKSEDVDPARFDPPPEYREISLGM